MTKDNIKRKVFIDCGSNDGDTIRIFLKKFPDSENYELFAFEPNEDLIKLGRKNYVNTVVINKAVWTKNEDRKFYVGIKNGRSTNSRLEEFTNGRNMGKFSSEPIVVQCIDFSAWIKDTFNIDDEIILKLDIEGSEYDVIEKMIEDGTIQYINQLYIEFHTTHKKSAATDGTALTKKMNSLGVKVFGNILGGQEFVAMFG